MKLYTLVCPNAFINQQTGASFTTTTSFFSLEEAEEQKKLCDAWDIDSGKKPQSYIVIEGDE